MVRGGGGRGGTKWRQAARRKRVCSCTLRKRMKGLLIKMTDWYVIREICPIIIHDVQNAATHQKKVISDQSLKCKYLKTYVLPHSRSFAQHNLCCVKGSGRNISWRYYMDNFWEHQLIRNGNKSKIIKWRNFQMMLFRKLAYPTPPNFMYLYQGQYNEIRKSKQVLLSGIG